MNRLGVISVRVIIGLFSSLIVLALLYVFIPDEKRSPLSLEMEQRAHSMVGGYPEGYIYLMGIDAPEGVEPAQLGLRRIHNYQEYLASKNHDYEDWDYEDPTQVGSLRLLMRKDWGACTLSELECVKGLLADASLLQKVTRQSEIQFKRYQHLLKLSNFESMLIPSLSGPQVPYYMIVHGNNALAFRVLQAAKTGQGNEAVQWLLDDIVQVRQMMKSDTGLIGRYIELKVVENDLRLINVLQAWGYAGKTTPIKQLSKAERSLETVLLWNFAEWLHSLRNLTEHPNMISFDYDLPSSVNRLVFKENRTINDIAEKFTDFARISELPPNQFSQSTGSQIEYTLMDKILNPVGTEEFDLNSDYNTYVAQAQNISVQIDLFNQLQQGSSSFSSLYSASPDALKVTDEQVCFKRVYPRSTQPAEKCFLRLNQPELSSPRIANE